MALQLQGLRDDMRRREGLLARREAQVRDLSLKLAEAVNLAARERGARDRAEAQLDMVRTSRFWPLVRRAYGARASLRGRANRVRARFRHRGRAAQ